MLNILDSFTGQWATRAEIAQRLGKRRLNPHEVATLDLLAERGQIEAEKRGTTGAIGYQWIYRIKKG